MSGVIPPVIHTPSCRGALLRTGTASDFTSVTKTTNLLDNTVFIFQ